MKIKVLLFAQAKQLAGMDSIEVDVADDCTVAALKDAISTGWPKLKALLERSSIALDQKYAVDSDLVSTSAEVAMIPPVSGG